MHTNRLTERGGVALVSFHLARLSYEYAVTEPACVYGDIWAQIGQKKIGIEVKTTRRGGKWHIKRSQLERVDIYCLVDLDLAHCYVLTSAEMRAIAEDAPDIYDGVANVSDRALPKDSFKGWSRLTSARTRVPLVPTGSSRRYGALKKNGEPRAPRIVKRTLADGTIKAYSYGPRCL